MPEALVLNNTLQIVYAEDNPAAGEVEYGIEDISTLDDTEFVPVLKKAMAPADFEYRLDVYFDVSAPCDSTMAADGLSDL